jgi:quercetin dioxygenase-like cupin family protein
MNPVVASDKLKRTEVWVDNDEPVHWAGAFAVYGGHGTAASSTIVYEIEPGHRLGWHTDATEETQYIIAGTGELHMEDGSTYRVGSGGVFAIPTPVKHDSSMSARKHCAPSRFSRLRCSPKTSTT